jgi:hypothetical protein
MLDATPRSMLARRIALVLAVLLVVGLAGCTREEEERFLKLLLVLALIGVVVIAALLTLLITNILHMMRGTPSLGWGVTSCVVGALIGLSSFGGRVLLGFVPAGSLGTFAFAAALVWVGQKNVREVQRRAALKAIVPPPPDPPAQ